MFNNSQKGVSLIITFFISIIILFIVLSISALLYSEIKIIRNMGNSMNAFYAAESGVEKVLYYDRKMKVGDTRGICNVCTSGVCPDCVCSPPPTGSDCNPATCSDCEITFSTEMGAEKSYEIKATVSQQCKISNISLNSYGFYKNVSRAINFGSVMKTSSLIISNPGATITAQGKVTVTATVSDPDGVGIESVVAAIYGLGDDNSCNPTCSPKPCCMYREIDLESGGGGTWSKPWNYGRDEITYTINIFAMDNLGYCVQVSNVTVTPI